MFTKANAEAYFLSEKSGSLFIMVVGAIALIAAAFLFFYLKSSTAKGIAIPLAAIALLQLIAGFTVYNRSDKQRADVVYSMDLDPQKLQQKELPRMQKVLKDFTMYQYSQVGLILIGLILVLVFRNNPQRAILFGVGIGIIIQGAILLSFDFMAYKRAKTYSAGLETFLTQQPA